MAGFLYYIPEGVKPDAFLRGRADVFGPKASAARRGVTKGPDEKPGTIIVLEGDHKPAVRYIPDEQQWQQAPGREWWLGMVKAATPTPADLARAEQHPSHPVRLQDGNEWLIPAVTLWEQHDGAPAWTNALPHQLRMRADGKTEAVPLPCHAWLIEQAERLWRALYAAQDGVATIDIDDEWRIAIEVLRMNYHVGPEEVSVLNLLTTANILGIFRAIVDLPGYLEIMTALQEAEAKKVPAGAGDTSSTGSGETAKPPDTDQPSQTLNSTSKVAE